MCSTYCSLVGMNRDASHNAYKHIEEHISNEEVLCVEGKVIPFVRLIYFSRVNLQICNRNIKRRAFAHKSTLVFSGNICKWALRAQSLFFTHSISSSGSRGSLS